MGRHSESSSGRLDFKALEGHSGGNALELNRLGAGGEKKTWSS